MAYKLLELEKARKLEHPYGFVYELLRTDKFNLALVEMSDDKEHYHLRATEYYYFLDGKGRMKLDNETVDVKPGTSVVIEPGTRHRAKPFRGKFKLLVFSVPPYDPKDEFYD